MGRIVGFVMWALCALLFIGMGIYNMFAKTFRPFGFWANADTIPVEAEQVRAYNRALGKLWIAAGILFLVLGLPLLGAEQNSPWVIVSILGSLAECIGMMAVYVLVIEKKYRKQ